MEYASILLIPLVHELGHWLAALVFGSRLSFAFEWGKFYVPRWTWRWPDVTPLQLKVICLAGFGMELGIAPFMPLPYQVAAILHFWAYPFYAGEKSGGAGGVSRDTGRCGLVYWLYEPLQRQDKRRQRRGAAGCGTMKGVMA